MLETGENVTAISATDRFKANEVSANSSARVRQALS